MLSNTQLTADTPTLRCAIYTRKSREEGLDKDFNSLEAQRLAGENHIASQCDKGWILLPEHYDDAGYSGDDPKRPALNKLFNDIREGLIDCIVVYRLDRLARSVLGLLEMRQFFDEYGVTFFSLTEQFNTTTAVGRLALGMSATFAEYEKDISSERVRHKIAASKKLGMWMGGRIPLGYDVNHRKLFINQEEANIVKMIYQRFLETHSITTVVRELNSKGLTTKSWIVAKTGKRFGGHLFRKGSVRNILTNPIYIGKVTNHGDVYEGQHEAIIDDRTWENVKQTLQQTNKPRAIGSRITTPPLLKGLLRCGECGAAMVPSYTSKKQKMRYRYYICDHKQSGKQENCTVGRLSAGEVEFMVVKKITNVLKNPETITKTITAAQANTPLSEFEVINALQSIESVWDELFPAGQTEIITLLTHSIVVNKAGIYLNIYKEALSKLAYEMNEVNPEINHNQDDTTISIFIPIAIKKQPGRAMIILPKNSDDSAYSSERYYDEKLINAFARAYQWKVWIKKGKFSDVKEISEKEKLCLREANRIYRLNLVAPSIVEAVLNGKQPRTLCLRDLLRKPIPLLWCEQREVFGFEDNTANNQTASNQLHLNQSTSTQLQEVKSC